MIDVGSAVGYLDLDVTKFKSGFNSAMTDLKTFTDQSATMADKFSASGKLMAGAGLGMTKSITVPLAGAGIAALKFATDFDTGVKKFSTVMDTTVIPVEKMSENVLKLSEDVNISSTELAEGLYQVLSATNDTASAMGYLEISAKLAKGGFTDTAKAVDGATSVLNAYGLKGTEAFQSVADMMLITQNLGKTTVDELAGALFNVVPTAAAAGIGFDQVSAALAAITAQGTPTSVATTQLRSAMQAFVKPNEAMAETLAKSADGMIAQQKISGPLVDSYLEQKAALDELTKQYQAVDTSTKEGKASAKDFQAAIKEQKKAVNDAVGGLGTLILGSEGLSGAFKIATDAAGGNNKALGDMLGSVEAMNAALQLTSDVGAEKYATSLEAMKDSAGATETAFDTMSSTAAEGFSSLLNKLKNVGIQFGTLILPSVLKLTDAIGGMLSWILSLDEGTKQIILTVATVLASIGPLLLIAGKLITAVTTISALIGGAGGLSAILTALSGPIGWVIAGVAALLLAWTTNLGGIRDFTADLMKEIGDILSSGADVLKQIWDFLFKYLGDIVLVWWKNIDALINMVLDTLLSLFKIFISALKGDWKAVWEEMKNIVNNIWDTIKTMFMNFLNAIVDTLIRIGANLLSAAKGAFENIKTGFSNVWETIKSWFNQVREDPIRALLELKDKFFNTGKDILNSLWSGLKNTWASIVSWVEDAIEWLKSKVALWDSESKKMDSAERTRGKGDEKGSYAGGLDYVPRDMTVRVHEGEKILTKQEAKGSAQSKARINVQVVFTQPVDSNTAKKVSKEIAQQTEKELRSKGVVLV